ncbi:MAG TPA: polysaccharide lyase family protein, partial [Calditrichia bacterium]|nr:polysaccharide lyase family protein [Calditrichia bacterium]
MAAPTETNRIASPQYRFFLKTIFTFIFLGFTALWGQAANPATPGKDNPAVEIREDEASFILSNGLVRAVISKKSGSIISLVYREAEMLAGRDGQASAMWSHDATSEEMITGITIDPAGNGGLRGEVSVKGISNGRPMGNGPGGSFIADIEIRHALEKDRPAIYTYCLFDHPAQYPASVMGEARFVAFLSNDFDWMSVDELRSRYYPLRKDELDLSKYTLTANQHDNPVFGWMNTRSKVGFWLINASMEYMSGGPTKNEFLCHRDTRVNGVPCVLNYWRSSHYGGSSVSVQAGEKWAKLIGPIVLYLNEAPSVSAGKCDAIAQGEVERKNWPYAWVRSPEYPLAGQRGTVRGKMILRDRYANGQMTNLKIGLTAPDYAIGEPGSEKYREVGWQFDAKYYQFWRKGDEERAFIIPNIRPGDYTLHAIADGVLGEYVKTDLTVKAGQAIDLGELVWEPLYLGKPLWEIGIPNRNGSEFLCGNRFFEWDLVKRYPEYFPEDVDYTIGESDFSRDWFIAQIPHVRDTGAPEANQLPERYHVALVKALGIETLPEHQKANALKDIEDLGLSGKYALGESTTWKINFELPEAISGELILRLAICGGETTQIAVAV